MPLYEQWDGLFMPGKKSFWERWLVCDPPLDQSRKYYAGVDTTNKVPSMEDLKEQFRKSQLRMNDIKEKETSSLTRKCQLPPIVNDNAKTENDRMNMGSIVLKRKVLMLHMDNLK